MAGRSDPAGGGTVTKPEGDDFVDDGENADDDPDPDGELGCEHGTPLLTPCASCRATLLAYLAQAQRDTAAKKYDSEGYTPAERGEFERSTQGELFG